MLRFVSSLCWATFQAKDNVRSAPASSALTLVSHQSHSAHSANRHPCGSRQRNGAQRRTKVSLSRTIMQSLKRLWLAKRHIMGRNDIEQAWSFGHYRVTLV